MEPMRLRKIGSRSEHKGKKGLLERNGMIQRLADSREIVGNLIELVDCFCLPDQEHIIVVGPIVDQPLLPQSPEEFQ